MALEAQCKYLAGSLKNIDLKNLISTKSERFTARTGLDQYPSTVLFICGNARKERRKKNP